MVLCIQQATSRIITLYCNIALHSFFRHTKIVPLACPLTYRSSLLTLMFIDLERDSAIRVQALMALAAYSVRQCSKAFRHCSHLIAALSPPFGYEDSVKAYRDINNAINTAKKEAKAEGLVEGEAIGAQKTARENARKMKSKRFSVEDIAEVTGLTITEIDEL